MPHARPTLAALTCAMAIPPAAFLLGIALLDEAVPGALSALRFWMWWGIVGCVAGSIGAALLSRRSKWWFLLALPAFVDAFIAFGVPFVISMGRTH